MNNEVHLYPSGGNKKEKSIFERLLNSKNISALVVASLCSGAYHYFSTDYIKYISNKSEINKIIDKANLKSGTAKLLYKNTDMGHFWKDDDDIYIGMSNPKMEDYNKYGYFTIDKVNDDGSITRYEARKTKYGYVLDEDVVHAEPYKIDFENPYTKEKDSMSVLIEKGHTWQELKILTKLLSMAAETTICYDKMIDASSLHGRAIYSAVERRSSFFRLGYYGQIAGLVYTDLVNVFDADSYKEDGDDITTSKEVLFEAFSTLSHEIGHVKLAFSNKYFTKLPVIESWARISAFLAEKEFIKNNPEFKFSYNSSFISVVYEANKNQNLSSENMMKILVLGDFHISSLARGYGSDVGDKTDFNNDIELLKANVLKGLDVKEFSMLNFSEEDSSDYIKKRLEVLSAAFEYAGGGKARDDFPDIYATITDQATGKKVKINVCHILNPNKSGVKGLSGLGLIRVTRFDKILNPQKARD